MHMPTNQQLSIRFLLLSLCWVSLVITCGTLVSCRPESTTPTSSGEGQPPVDPPTPPSEGSAQPTSVFADWDSPAAVLVFSGDVHGYLEPCGCTERQSGGFARRADLLRQIREEQGWPVVAFDNGGSIDERRVSYPQTRIKFSIILDGLNRMDYAAMGWGAEEMMLGAQNLYEEYIRTSAEEDFDVPFLASNVTLYGAKDLGTPGNTRIIRVGETTIGVTAITGNSIKTQLDQTGLTQDESEVRIDEPVDVLPEMINELKAHGPDLLVLLSHADMEESQSLAERFPEFNIVVTAHSLEDPKPDPVWIGETLLVQTGKKGKNAPVVGFFPGTETPLRLKLLELDMDRFATHPDMVELMADYQAKLQEAWPELSQDSIADPGDQFVGGEACQDCHEDSYDVWIESGHSHAYESLIKGRPSMRDHWVSRIYDPECLCCHAVGWDPQSALRYESGFIDIETNAHLKGVQCESCHGPGAKHVGFEQAVENGSEETDEVLAARTRMRVSRKQAKSTLCIQCHDLDNSPDFDFDEYWPNVEH